MRKPIASVYTATFLVCFHFFSGLQENISHHQTCGASDSVGRVGAFCNFATLKNQDFGKPKSGAPIMILIIKQQLKTVAEMSACSMDKLSALSTMK